MQPAFPGFTGSNATRTGYMIRKFLNETVDATQFRGEYDFKETRYAEVLLILAEALYEKNATISASSCQFLPKHYLDPLPLQQVQLSKGTLDQNPEW